MIDENYIAERVGRLRALGLRAFEGYYLVVLSPPEARELVSGLAARHEKPKRRHKHPPTGLTASAERQGYDVACVLGDARVVSIDHTQDAPRCSRGSLG